MGRWQNLCSDHNILLPCHPQSPPLNTSIAPVTIFLHTPHSPWCLLGWGPQCLGPSHPHPLSLDQLTISKLGNDSPNNPQPGLPPDVQVHRSSCPVPMWIPRTHSKLIGSKIRTYYLPEPRSSCSFHLHEWHRYLTIPEAKDRCYHKSSHALPSLAIIGSSELPSQISLVSCCPCSHPTFHYVFLTSCADLLVQVFSPSSLPPQKNHWGSSKIWV